MANANPIKDKTGKIIGYQIRVYKGRDAKGKQLKPYSMVWHIPEGMTNPRTIKKELEKVKKAKESERLSENLSEARRAIKLHLKENSDIIDPVETREIEGYVLPRELKAGDEVVVITLNRKGKVTSYDGKNAMVLVGTMQMKLPPKALMLIDGETVTFKEKAKKPKAATGDREITGFNAELDLRGEYGDDGCFILDKYIDEAKCMGVHEIRVIHGKGTGALRKAVTKFLKSDPRIKSTRIGDIGEGDTGVTIAELK